MKNVITRTFWVLTITCWANISVAAPITDTVTLEGRVWAQPADFAGVTWDEIDARCPGSICSLGTMLNGFDIGGWMWASQADMIGLINIFLRAEGVGDADLLRPDQLFWSTLDPTASDAFFRAFRAIPQPGPPGGILALSGFVDSQPPVLSFGQRAAMSRVSSGSGFNAGTLSALRDQSDFRIGAWLTRAAPLSTPSTVALCLSALLALRLRRRCV